MDDKDKNALKMIISYCDKIDSARSRFGDDFDVFNKDDDYKATESFYLVQIGEYAQKLSGGVRARAGDKIPWNAIKGLRNRIAHGYGSVQFDIIWDIITNLHALKKFCQGEIKQLDAEQNQEDDKQG